MRKTIKIIGFVVSLAVALMAGGASAASSAPTVIYERAQVISIQKPADSTSLARVLVQSGPDKGKTLTTTVGVPPSAFDIGPPVYKHGDTILMSRETSPGQQPVFVIVDHYRLSFAAWLLVAILVLAIIFAGWRGVGSILGLILSTAVLAGFVIPQILGGHSAYLSTAIGIAVISSIGIFVAHGFSKRTGLALMGTYLTLAVAVILAAFVVQGMHLTGITDENIFYLSQAKPNINIQGLLLCGMLISLVGVLDDITVGQATSIEELYRANAGFNVREVYQRGLKIGREHIASLVNTLVLVFVGTSFLFITYLSALSPYPWFVNLNTGVVMQEIARALIGSVALILAVPITTILAAKYLKPKPPSEPSRSRKS